MSKVYLQVPFTEKDSAKQLGARWDPIARAWYIPEGINAQAFHRWLPSQSVTVEKKLAVTSPFETGLQPTHSLLPDDQEVSGIRLSDLLGQVSNTLRKQFSHAVWVKGEITEWQAKQDGHAYLTLSEAIDGQLIAQARATIWASQLPSLLKKFQQVTEQSLGSGISVLVCVELNFHARFGLSLNIIDIDARFTLGEQQAKLQALRKTLIEQGLYHQNKQHPMPTEIRRVAVLSPAQAAGFGDFKADANALVRYNLCQFEYFHASFQGDRIETEWQQAMQTILQRHQQEPFDLLVIIRGGGAKQDLMQLNLLSLATIIAQAPIPVWTGIGHERDLTLLDEVAHRHFDTPSKVVADIRQRIIQPALQAKRDWLHIQQASKLVISHARTNLMQLQQRIQLGQQQRVQQAKSTLQQHFQHLLVGAKQQQAQHKQALALLQQVWPTAVSTKLQLQRQELAHWQTQIIEQSQRHCRTSQQRLEQLHQQILSVHPQRWLSSGYALVTDKTSGELLHSITQLHLGQELRLRLHDGEITVIVQQVLK